LRGGFALRGVFEGIIVPKILHGTRIFQDPLVREGLLRLLKLERRALGLRAGFA
jgi:hypothetical protein